MYPGNQHQKQRSVFYNVDWLTIFLYVCLVLIGWVNIYAAVYDVDHQSILDLDRNYGKQLLWILSSGVLITVVLLLDSKFFSVFAFSLYGLTIVLLLLVLVIGTSVGGNQAWIAIGDFRLQPSEFAKVATALALARFLSGNNIRMQDFNTKFISFAIIGVPVALILLQKDAGSALTFTAFILVLYREGLSSFILIIGAILVALFIFALIFNPVYVAIVLLGAGGLMIYRLRKRRKLITVIALGMLISFAFIFATNYLFYQVLQPHQRSRIEVLLKDEVDLRGVGYNLNQSKIAIGSGGLTGKGFLKGTQTKYNFVPEQSTDFIFCTIGEEWGFLGSTLVIGLYIALLFRIVHVAERQR
ncbi:MAG TPA: rod shape-determining protein RodA, partial [Anseongella sp.]|nr:rod shape-determining protein RodA [Anseongella sp.]